MKIIVGLGNPGQEYIKTRHNLGYMVLDQLAKSLSASNFTENSKFHGYYVETSKLGEKIILLKPTTFMNNSGISIASLNKFYKLPTENIWVVHDELALNFGQMRVRRGGGSAGHNGIKSISQAIGEDFVRFRLGINNSLNDKMDSEKFVLSQFTQNEKDMLAKICNQVSEIILQSITQSLQQTSYELI